MFKEKIVYIFLTFILVLYGCGSADQSGSSNDFTTNSTAALNGVTPTSAEGPLKDIYEDEPIKRHTSRYYSGGRLMGTPIKASLKRAFSTLLLAQTYEFEINFGNVVSNNTYLGTLLSVSSESKNIFDQFKKLSRNEMYIFEYEYPFALNPEIEHTHYLITKIIPVKADFNQSGLPQNIQPQEYRRGSYSEEAGRVGRIINVERRGWGYFEPTCNITLNHGALSSNSGSSSREHRENFSVYGEKACRWSELVMEYDVDVNIEYSEQYIELFHSNAKVVHK